MRYSNDEERAAAKYHDLYREGRELMLKEMNKECMFNESTGEIVLIKSDGKHTIINVPNARNYFAMYSFHKEEGDKRPTNSFDMWLTANPLRRNIVEIVFEPLKEDNPKYFNLWNGYAIQKAAETWDEEAVKPWLDHILNVWCDGDEAQYEYVLDWFAQLIQKPDQKTCVCLGIKGKQVGDIDGACEAKCHLAHPRRIQKVT